MWGARVFAVGRQEDPPFRQAQHPYMVFAPACSQAVLCLCLCVCVRPQLHSIAHLPALAAKQIASICKLGQQGRVFVPLGRWN